MKISRCKYRTSLAAFTSALLLSVSARAGTVTVTSIADAGGSCPGATCTLRQAIATAISGDTITFSLPANSAITLTSAELLINKNLTINGPGANLLSIQRSSASSIPDFRIFDKASGIVTISGLTIANGNGQVSGSGILNQGSGTLTITSCTISGNSAGATGGGGIHTSEFSGMVTIINSTISGNTVCCGGNGGGGIYKGTGTVTARNTIIAQNIVPAGGSPPDFSGTLTSNGYNLIGDTTGTTIVTGATGTTTGNQLDVNPMLDTLKDNGGQTQTHALLASSPAIDKGHSSGSTMDQRGFGRPVDTSVIPNNTGDGSDIGAYEVQADMLPGCSSTVVTNNNDDGSGSLRFVIVGACVGSTITFAPNVTGAINLMIGQLLIDKNLTINGPGANVLSVQRSPSAGDLRIFKISPLGVIASISGLTIANGSAPADGTASGGIANNGKLTLTNCTVSGNTNNKTNGGGILNSSGTLRIVNSTISGNSTTAGFAGGIYNHAGTLTIINSTISGNSATESFSGVGLGGGILNTNGGTLILTNSTISGNTGQFRAGGIRNTSDSTVRARNTIIALNTSPTGPDVDGALTSEGFNLIGSKSGANITPSAFPDQIGVTADEVNLGPLQDNGGQTQTQAPMTGSRAIDKGDSSGFGTDQRGFPRPSDFLAIANAAGGDNADTGAFEVQAPTPTPSPTATPSPAPGLVGNVSTRLPVGTGDNALFGGFIVQGPAGSTKKIMVRAIGPSLLPFGVNDALGNPTLEIRDGSNAVVATNDDWRNTQAGGLITGDQFPEINGSGLAPSDDLESAIIADLAPGGYTAVVRGFGDTNGTGVVDAYDLSAASPARLANVATRGLIQPGDKLMIAGFIIQNGPVRAVIRAVGPSLVAFDVANALADTTLQLQDQNGTIVMENDNWETDQKQELESTGLQPSHQLEAAIVVTIQPGQYTAHVRGKDETTGTGVVQVYFLQ